MQTLYYSLDCGGVLSRRLNVPACSEIVCKTYGHHYFKWVASSNISKWSSMRRRWIWEEKELKLWYPATLPHVDSLPSAPTSDHLHLMLFKEKMASLIPKRLTIIRSQMMTRKDDQCMHLKQGLKSYKSIYTQLFRNLVICIKVRHSVPSGSCLLYTNFYREVLVGSFLWYELDE